MVDPAPASQTVRFQSGPDWLELTPRQPARHLRPYVIDYCGYREATVRPMRRRHLPAGRVVLIIDFGPTLTVRYPEGKTADLGMRHAAGFAAGLHDVFAVTETTAAQNGIQVNLTPIGARRLFGLPLAALANTAVGLEELFGAAGRRLIDRCHEMASWDDRFAALDRLITARLRDAPSVPADIAWGWRRLRQTDGRLGIGPLAAEIGHSRKHLIARFREHLGMPPKRLARILRFDRAVRQTDGRRAVNWAEIAHDCGYFDQAHFIRDFRRFAGSTPREFLGRRLTSEDGTMTD